MIYHTDQLINFIKIYKGMIEQSLCNQIIKESENYIWVEHCWSKYNIKKNNSKEFERSLLSNQAEHFIKPIFLNCIDRYGKEFNLEYNDSTKIQVNKYILNTSMKEHYDHIHNIFDGKDKGIPVLSIIGLLNDDFLGGEFCICNTTIELKRGDIIIFPSIFLFPHRVTPITDGIRYSLVSWAW